MPEANTTDCEVPEAAKSLGLAYKYLFCPPRVSFLSSLLINIIKGNNHNSL